MNEEDKPHAIILRPEKGECVTIYIDKNEARVYVWGDNYDKIFTWVLKVADCLVEK